MKETVWWEMECFERAFEMNFEFCSMRAAVRRNTEAQTMDHNLHSIPNRSSKIMNHILVVKLIKLKLFRKMIFVYCDKKFKLKQYGQKFCVLYFKIRWHV